MSAETTPERTAHRNGCTGCVENTAMYPPCWTKDQIREDQDRIRAYVMSSVRARVGDALAKGQEIEILGMGIIAPDEEPVPGSVVHGPEPVDRKLLHENVRFAIADPGHFLSRKDGEPVSHWSARAVMDVLGLLGMLGAPGDGYATLPASSVAVSGATAASPEGEGGEGQNDAQRGCEPFCFCGKCWTPEQQREAEIRQLAYCEASVQASADPEDGEQCSNPRKRGSVYCEQHRLSPLPDSETEWGYRAPWGATTPQSNEAEARRWVEMSVPGARVLVRREVGPWTAVDASGDAR